MRVLCQKTMSAVDLYMHVHVVRRRLLIDGLDGVYAASVLVILYLQWLSLCVTA